MFLSMYNSLRTVGERLAFSANSPNDPAEKFVEFITHTCNVDEDESQQKRIKKDGYNSLDMLHYLQWLKSGGYIQSFTWRKNKKWKASDPFFKKSNVNAVLLFGHLLTMQTCPRSVRRVINASLNIPRKHIVARTIPTAPSLPQIPWTKNGTYTITD
jgi:hypothetical protein